MKHAWAWAAGLGVIGLGVAIAFSRRGAWIDDFLNYDPRWEWGYQSGTGYQIVDEQNSRAVIGIRPQIGDYYSDCALRTGVIYRSGRMEAVLSCTDNGLHPYEGTRGWGFWDGRIQGTNAAWFWCACEHSAQIIQGFQVNILRDGVGVFQQMLLGVDITQPHTYAVEIGGGCRFYVDGELLAASDKEPLGRQRIELWIDNQSIAPDGTKSVHPVLADQIMNIDYVSYRP